MAKPSSTTLTLLAIANLLLVVSGLTLAAILAYYLLYVFVDQDLVLPFSRTVLTAVGGSAICSVIAYIIASPVKTSRHYLNNVTHVGKKVAYLSLNIFWGAVLMFMMSAIEDAHKTSWIMMILLALFVGLTVSHWVGVITTFFKIRQLEAA